MEQFLQLFNRLTLAQRTSLVFFVILVTGGIILSSYLINQEDYQLLYSGMSTEDMGAVLARLKTQKVPYKLEMGGTGVSVPSARVDEVRVQMAAEGLPQSGRIGFEIFDKSNFGMSEFAEQVNFRRALEGELARSISSMTEITSARVHLVLPKAALFREQDEKAKASVVVKLRSGKGLSTESIFGIGYLVASAVPGLDHRAVSIMDIQGKILSLPARSNLAAGMSQPEVETQLGLEKELNAKIMSILEPVVGKGKVSARTSVELNLDRIEETSETFDPDKSAILHRQVSRETNGNGKAEGGIVGVAANQETPGTSGQDALGSKRSRQDEKTEFELSKTVRHIIQATGKIKKISVAVIVDNKLVYKQDAEGKQVPTYLPREQEELRKIQDLVIAAIGFNEERGDKISVENLPFQLVEVPAEEPVTVSPLATYLNYAKPLGRYLGIALVALLAYLVLLRPMMNKVMEGIQSIGDAETSLLPEAGLPDSRESSAALPSSSAEPPRRLADVERDLENKIENELNASEYNEEAKRAAMMKKRIVALAQEKPDETAQLIRTWVSSDR